MCPGRSPELVLPCVLLLCQGGETSVDAAELVKGENRLSGEDVLEVFHGYGFDPPEPHDIEHGPRVCEDDGAMNPETLRPGLPQEFLEPSDIAA